MARSIDVCIVGAGMSGLVAIKEWLDEGHRVTCFERASKEGGNFNYPTGVAYDSMSLTVSQYHAEVRQLYKHVFHPDLGERVAFIGWARPAQGGIPACSEMQSRYFALLCSGKRTLPEKHELRRLIAQDREAEERAFYARRSQGTLCSYTPYMDALAEIVGCRPRIRDFLFKPRLAYHLLCGANIPTAYRLCGPHAAPEMAQRVILSLPIAHGTRELLTLSYLHILTRLGVFVEPEEAKVYEKAPA